MKKNNVRDFYNQAFFDEEGKAKEAHLVVTLKNGAEEITIPGIKVQASSTLEELCKAFYQYLDQEETVAVDKPIEDKNTDQVPLDFNLVVYQNKEYMVEEVAEDQFKVIRLETKKVLSPKSPTTKAILKLYKTSQDKNL